MIVVAGGTYIESCLWPKRDDLFGSAGRAAYALKVTGCQVSLRTFAPKGQQEQIESAFASADLPMTFSESEHLYSFTYRHPLATPHVDPFPVEQTKVATVQSDVVLRFGSLEGNFVTTARRAVYDPQSSTDLFTVNGSTASELSIVLNLQELQLLGKQEDEAAAVASLFKQEKAVAIVVKNGPFGANVYVGGSLVEHIAPLETSRVTKIGTGDIFSAAYTYWWATKGDSPTDAAKKASLCVAAYCDSKCLNFEEATQRSYPAAPLPKSSALIYLAGPFFSAGQFFLIEELLIALEKLGGRVFSPYHDVGIGDAHDVAPRDLKGLEEATAVLAVVDGCDAGTLFEIGYARKRGIPVVALAENPKDSDLTMLVGSDCIVQDDLTSAVYNAIWNSWR